MYFFHLSATVINNGTDNARPVVSVIQEDLALNADRYTPTTDAGVSYCISIILHCTTKMTNQLYPWWE